MYRTDWLLMTDMRKNKKIYTEISNLYVNMFSDIFDEYMSGENIGVNKAKEAEFFRRYRKIKRNAFIKKVIVISVSALTVLALFAGCFNPISEFIINIYDKFANLSVSGSSDAELSIEEVVIGYIPLGFSLTDTVFDTDIKFCRYSNSDDGRFFTISIENGRNLIKGVDVESSEYIYNPYSFISQKGDSVILIVCYKNLTVEIFGQISRDEAVRVAAGCTQK